MTIFYHNPDCSKSRAALVLVQEHCNETGEPLHLIEYLKHPPDEDQLAMIEDQLGGDFRDMLRTPEDAQLAEEFEAAAEEGREEFLALLSDYPELLQRPIVMRGEQAVIARPPELVHQLWEEND